MRYDLRFLFFFIFFVSLSLNSEATKNHESAKIGSTPAFWKVESTHSKTTIYLLGSMHFGLDDFYPLPKAIMQAFSNSESLAVEVNVDAINPLQAQQVVGQLGVLPSNKTLNSLLGQKELKNLKNVCDRLGIQMSQLQHLRPWMAALQIVTLQMSSYNFKSREGIDRYFLSRSHEKAIIELESLQSQLALFNQVDEQTQIEFLKLTLNEYEQGESFLLSISDAWQKGDTEQLKALVLDGMQQEPKITDLFTKLFTDRNVKMAAQIGKMFEEQDKDVFVVVGAGHLLGDTGIVELLGKDFSIERVSFSESKKKK